MNCKHIYYVTMGTPVFGDQKDTTDRVRIQTILSMDYSSFLLRAYVKD